MDNIDQFVEQILNIDNSKSPSDIRKDLEYTKSVEATLNRIFDGEFLQGIKTSNKPDNALIILDSDEEDIALSNSQTSS
jgi:ribosomal protein S2